MSRLDVLVVGGGPAGSAVATLAARAGARVVVLERDRFPREKVCGEFLSAEGCAVLDRLGALDLLRRAGAAPMDRCVVSAPSGREVEAVLPAIEGVGRAALGIGRALLDRTLLDLAARSGAEVRERVEAVEPILEDLRVVGVTTRAVGAGPGRDLEFRASVVVAADGRRSTIQRALDPAVGDPSRSGPRSWFGLKRHLRPGSRGLDGRVELHLFQGGYAGVGEIEGGRVNLCLLTTVRALRSCGGSGDRLLEERVLRNPRARQSLAGSEPASDWLAVGPLRFGARRPVLAGALFLGDSAGPVDPFSGEGMSNALTGAELAVPVVLTAAARGGLDDALARRWTEAWTASFGKTLARARRIGILFERPWLGRAALFLAASPGGGRIVSRLVAATRTGLT